mmetsp:Transcript_14989/g.53376  ORF Transcript_14989/g.53376 Transcript_14989/m.53376 type:complete len:370 (-) Transcript_14989:75-1184(-)
MTLARLALILAVALGVDPGLPDPFGLRVDWPMDDHVPVESLPFFQAPAQAANLALAQRFRGKMRARPLFRWVEPFPEKAMAVFEKTPRWLKRGPNLGKICVVPCKYADDAGTADATLQNLRASNGGPKTSIHGVLSYESCRGGGCMDGDGSTIVLSYSRHSDVVYEFFRRSDIQWDARPLPTRPESRVAGSVVFVSDCNGWRLDYLKALSQHGVDVKFAGTCEKNFDVPQCKRNMAFTDCKIEALRLMPFAITFENLPIDDYVTEKWGHMWSSGMIPVYCGSPLIYEKASEYPPFINVHDYAGPAELAAYLDQVVKNDTLWARYTARGPLPPQKYKEGKRWDGIELDVHVCDLCMAAHSSVQSKPWWTA